MPYYRINIKLEQLPVKEYLIEDDRREVDVVYQDYKRRVFDKNGAGRVTYFDLVMVSSESLEHQADRMEVYNEQNDYGFKRSVPPVSKWGKQSNAFNSKGKPEERRQRK